MARSAFEVAYSHLRRSQTRRQRSGAGGEADSARLQMTKRRVITPALDGELAERIATYKRTFDADVAAVKRGLAQWLDAHPSNSTATPIALLETAFDRTLAERTTVEFDLASAAADLRDMVQAVLRCAVLKRRATLQMRQPIRHATPDHRPSCPCCCGRMIIVEVFACGGEPRGPPSGAGIKT